MLILRLILSLSLLLAALFVSIASEISPKEFHAKLLASTKQVTSPLRTQAINPAGTTLPSWVYNLHYTSTSSCSGTVTDSFGFITGKCFQSVVYQCTQDLITVTTYDDVACTTNPKSTSYVPQCTYSSTGSTQSGCQTDYSSPVTPASSNFVRFLYTTDTKAVCTNPAMYLAFPDNACSNQPDGTSSFYKYPNATYYTGPNCIGDNDGSQSYVTCLSSGNYSENALLINSNKAATGHVLSITTAAVMTIIAAALVIL